MNTTKAQKLTFLSKTWADRLGLNIQLQQDLIEAIRQISEEDPSFKVSFEFEPDPDESGNEPDKNE